MTSLGAAERATFRFAANASILFPELPLLRRPSAAAQFGYRAVELWWPFDSPVASDRQTASLCRALRDSDVELASLNLDAGDMRAGDRGLISALGQTDRVLANARSAVRIAGEAGCRIVNALYGNRLPGADPEAQDAIALEHLSIVAAEAAVYGIDIVIETLNSMDNPRYPLVDLAVTCSVIRRVRERSGLRNIGLLLDVYHLAKMGCDVPQAVTEAADLVAHVQFADLPDRRRPGRGSVDFDAVLSALTSVGYQGFIGLEYEPQPGEPRWLPPVLTRYAHGSATSPNSTKRFS
jgi:hydroxypyruvate isomerase